MKICRACKSHKPVGYLDCCKHPEHMTMDFVSGKLSPLMCVVKNQQGDCPFWAQKPPSIYRRIWAWMKPRLDSGLGPFLVSSGFIIVFLAWGEYIPKANIIIGTFMFIVGSIVVRRS